MFNVSPEQTLQVMETMNRAAHAWWIGQIRNMQILAAMALAQNFRALEALNPRP